MRVGENFKDTQRSLRLDSRRCCAELEAYVGKSVWVGRLNILAEGGKLIRWKIICTEMFVNKL